MTLRNGASSKPHEQSRTLSLWHCPLSLLYWSQARASFSSCPVGVPTDIPHLAGGRTQVPSPHMAHRTCDLLSICLSAAVAWLCDFFLISKPVRDGCYTGPVNLGHRGLGRTLGFVSSMSSERPFSPTLTVAFVPSSNADFRFLPSLHFPHSCTKNQDLDAEKLGALHES